MAAKRSRTGCATCRQRKLKCDETRPICKQCIKSKRVCEPSDGIAFRHEQNASMNTEHQDGKISLGNFYKYRNDYTAEQLRNFVPVGPHFEWRYITDVYAEDNEQTPPRNPSSPQSYQREVASHSLEALSTAAAENQAYQPPVTYAEINNFYQGANGGYGPAASNMHGPNQNNNIKFLLNPSNTPAAMIDPNLDTSALESMREEAEANVIQNPKLKHGSEDKNDDSQQHVTNEEQVAYLLKTFDEQSA